MKAVQRENNESTGGTRSFLRWLPFCLTAAAIFAVVPYARSAQQLVRVHINARELFLLLIAVQAILFVAGLVFLLRARLARTILPPLLLVGANFLCCSYLLRTNPEEVVHFFEYGLLGITALRGWRGKLSGAPLHITAFASCLAVGVLDETIQLLTPGRFFDPRDIFINAWSAFLVLAGLQIAEERRRVSARTVHESSRSSLLLHKV